MHRGLVHTPAPAPFRLQFPTDGPAVVEVDGVDQAPGLTGIVLVAGFGQPTRLELHRAGPGDATGGALIEEHGPGGGVDPAAVAAAVRGIDPDQVRAILVDLDLDLGSDGQAAHLEAIARIIEATP